MIPRTKNELKRKMQMVRKQRMRGASIPLGAFFLLVETQTLDCHAGEGGVHNHRPAFMESGFRRNDNEGRTVNSIS
jgi:hypothetical protein